MNTEEYKAGDAVISLRLLETLEGIPCGTQGSVLEVWTSALGTKMMSVSWQGYSEGRYRVETAKDRYLSLLLGASDWANEFDFT